MGDTAHNTIQMLEDNFQWYRRLDTHILGHGHTFWGIYIDNNIIVGHNEVASESHKSLWDFLVTKRLKSFL